MDKKSLEDKRKNVALRIAPQFRQRYEKLMVELKAKDGQECRRLFADALLTSFLFANPVAFLACDTRAAQVRCLIDDDVWTSVLNYVETTNHHVPFSVFSYNAFYMYCTEEQFQSEVDKRYEAFAKHETTPRRLLVNTLDVQSHSQNISH